MSAPAMHVARPVVPANYSPIPYSKYRARRVPQIGRTPNPNLYAMSPAEVPSFVPLPLGQSTPLQQYPLPPLDLNSRAHYFAQCAPLAPYFKQRTQPWLAARSVACTASNAAAMLGIGFGTSDAHFRMFDEQHQVQAELANTFSMEWGVRHEMCGIASVMHCSDKVRDYLASEHQVQLPSEVCVFEQGLHFVPACHPLLQGTLFGIPSNPTPLAASPDALLVGQDFKMLIEVKSGCPFLERDDGTWLWKPSKRALGEQGVHMSHFVQCQVQMLAAGVQHCLLVGWDVEVCKVLYVPFDGEWCKQMLSILAIVMITAALLQGKCPDFSALPGHKEFAQLTRERCYALKEACTLESAKGNATALWLNGM